ncbi:MAG: Rhodococcus phage Jace [Pseudomonadota bacterium]
MAAANKTSAAKAVTLQRQQASLELRRMGMGYIEIGNRLGISKSQAHRLVQAGLADARAQIGAEANDLKSEEISRLDAMLAGLWPDARKGQHGAVDRVLKIMERRAKLLGLDAPVKLAHGGDGNAPPIKTEHAHAMTDADLERIASNGGP